MDATGIRHTIIGSPVGDLLLIADGDALRGLYFGAGKKLKRSVDIGERVPATDGVFAAAERQLGEYFAGRRTEFDLPLAPRGEEFDLQVWELLREIPYGETRAYGDLARRLGHVGFSQAVGRANGRNPLAIVVPCHRVVGADGSMTGFAGGIERKRFLLELEEPAEVKESRLF